MAPSRCINLTQHYKLHGFLPSLGFTSERYDMARANPRIFCVAVCISNPIAITGIPDSGTKPRQFYLGGYPPRLVHLWFLRSHFDMGNWLRIPDSHSVHQLMKLVCTLTPFRSPFTKSIYYLPINIAEISQMSSPI
jgi:hypothetical protein